MIYLSLDTSWARLLFVSKSILGQYDVGVFEKKYQTDLLNKGKITNVDLFASAIKEAVVIAGKEEHAKEKNVLIALPQEAFRFIRMTVPVDIAPTALSAFVKDKTRSSLDINLDDCVYDFLTMQQSDRKEVFFFCLEKDTVDQYREALQLIDLRLTDMVPETLSYFKLFDKTLRKEKRENIMYVRYEKDHAAGYLYDSLGLASEDRWTVNINNELSIENALKQKISELGEKSTKVNRLILGGQESDHIRQDTFTKEVGVWTNPLKRIIPQFYGEYTKPLVVSGGKPFPILTYDVCFGSFIFHEEHRNFSLMKNKKGVDIKKLAFPKISLPKKETFLFLASFVLSFFVFILISRLQLGSSLKKGDKTLKKTTRIGATAMPVPSPTPSIKREELKLKILNGSGIRGKATEVKELFKDKGYQEILTGNAESFDYEVTELKIKRAKKEVAGLIKSDLKQNLILFNESVLEATEAADIVIIVGKNFK